MLVSEDTVTKLILLDLHVHIYLQLTRTQQSKTHLPGLTVWFFLTQLYSHGLFLALWDYTQTQKCLKHKWQVRRDSELGAKSWNERVRGKIRYVCRRILCMERREDTNTTGKINRTDDVEEGKKKQYRLEAVRGSTRSSLLHFLTCGCLKPQGGRNRNMAIGINPNQQLAMYLHWMFRVNFLFLFCVMCVMFFVLVMFFAALIIIAGSLDSECVRIGGAPFGAVGSEFADAFALSWTTFSTVGYGSTYPALGSENTSPTNCFFITFICSLESLMGVLYSGFCGAILFGKVLRIQSHAQVIFSDPIVIRYGSGVVEGSEYDSADSDDDSDSQSSRQPKKTPCPVLEFRIVNRLFNEAGGEIKDATLNVVANVDANDADPLLVDALDADRSRYGQQSGTSSSGRVGNLSSHVETNSEDSSQNSENGRSSNGNSRHGSSNKVLPRNSMSLNKFLDPFHSLMGKIDHQTIDEDPSARLVSKRTFSKMLIEASDHPFFKRVWLARHVLDETSPIVKPRVRRQIRRNGGTWPDSLCTWNAIRDSLQFNQILVSLNGVSNVSASDVYAQKIYDFVDINVGYQFVNVLYKDTDGALKGEQHVCLILLSVDFDCVITSSIPDSLSILLSDVIIIITMIVDTDLINDVREQKGGGGEPLIIDE